MFGSLERGVSLHPDGESEKASSHFAHNKRGFLGNPASMLPHLKKLGLDWIKPDSTVSNLIKPDWRGLESGGGRRIASLKAPIGPFQLNNSESH